MEIKAIIEEFQMQALSGCMEAWELWEHALLPSLLSGAGTWLGDIEEAVELWDKTQNFFCRLILEVPESCIKVDLRSKTKIIAMKWRIWESKCLLLKQLQQLQDTALAKRVSQEAYEKGWPGEIRCSSKLDDIKKMKILEAFNLTL